MRTRSRADRAQFRKIATAAADLHQLIKSGRGKRPCRALDLYVSDSEMSVWYARKVRNVRYGRLVVENEPIVVLCVNGPFNILVRRELDGHIWTCRTPDDAVACMYQAFCDWYDSGKEMHACLTKHKHG